MGTMRVIVKKAFGSFSVGHVIPEMPGGMARTMIARNLVEECLTDELREADDEYLVFRPVDRMVRGSQLLRRAK